MCVCVCVSLPFVFPKRKRKVLVVVAAEEEEVFVSCCRRYNSSCWCFHVVGLVVVVGGVVLGPNGGVLRRGSGWYVRLDDFRSKSWRARYPHGVGTIGTQPVFGLLVGLPPKVGSSLFHLFPSLPQIEKKAAKIWWCWRT